MEESVEVDVENVQIDENPPQNTQLNESHNSPKQKYVRLPLARMKNIMKMDPDCELINRDSLFLVTKATEMFIEFLAKESVKFAIQSKRKTLLKKDVDTAIESIPFLCFLDGALE